MREIELKIRNFENMLQKNMGKIFCPVHLSLGHESVAADISECIARDDWLFSNHRNHHHYIAKGGSEQSLLDEIMGKESGLNGGFAGSQAIVDPSINFHSTAILGGLVGAAAGVAYAIKLNNQNNIVVCVIGDAGTEQGVFWESLNFSALHSLPIVYICENNNKSVDATLDERQATPIVPRVSAFGISVFQEVKQALEYTKNNKAPSFCEVKVTLECAHINMATMLDLCAQN